jgi:hypothetical protein
MHDQDVKAIFSALEAEPRPEFISTLRRRLEHEWPEPASGRRLAGKFQPLEEMHMTETSATDERQGRWRTPSIAAALIAVLGVGAIAIAVSNTNADDDEAVSPAPSATAAPIGALPTTTVARTATATISTPKSVLRVTYTVPEGWEVDGQGLLASGDSAVVNFWNVRNVYSDGCEWTMPDPTLGPTVDDLATWWAELPGFTATTPSDITIDGYAGKRVDFTVPDYDEADCFDGKFALWTQDGGSAPDFWAQVPMQQNRQWIVDVDGARLVVNEWSESGTPPEALTDTDELIASIQISDLE